MKFLQSKRDYTIDTYIMCSQTFFFLLIGMLFLRVSGVSFSNYFLKMPVTMIFCLLLALIPYLQRVSLNNANYYFTWDLLIAVLYIFIASFLLLNEADDFFKIVLLMPVIMMALKYGVKTAYFAAFISAAALLVISGLKDFVTIDADLVFSGVLFLLAWLLGNMTEKEHVIRQELERLATYDGLTNILNHRSFQELINQEVNKAKSAGKSVSLIMIDIDYFKYYNDAYGHQKGDEVLVRVAQIIQNVVGNLGYCARYGGEEFAVIIPGLNISVAKELGEEIRRDIENEDFPGKDVFPKGQLTVSVGIAEYPINADTKEKLIKKADEALYRAKFVSKNKVESYYSVFDEVGVFLKEEEQELFNSISAFTMVINAKDRYTYGHSLRVMEMAKKLAVRVELDPAVIQHISFGALLHDIGKVEISREVLNKPNKLNEKEWELFRQHPVWGANIIDPMQSLDETKSIILYHHENYDGSGYPEGISGESIPVGARVLRIVDSYDAMTTERPYKSAMSPEQALEDLNKYIGTFYDPVFLEHFEKMIREDIEEDAKNL